MIEGRSDRRADTIPIRAKMFSSALACAKVFSNEASLTRSIRGIYTTYQLTRVSGISVSTGSTSRFSS